MPLPVTASMARIPPLRSRREDIALLSRHFAAQYSNLLKKQVRLTGPALKVLENHAWPGNIRELENIIERICVTGRGNISATHVRNLLQDENVRPELPGLEDESMESLKRRHIFQVLEECGGVRTLAAKRLGMSRTSLWRILKCGPDRVDPSESN
jgi:propionate catabolism operon transcriptional regulator